jgi:predicted DNA-binding transcriptional regulator AlpA
MNTTAPAYLTDSQVGDRYCVTRCTVWRWVKAGRLPAPVRLSDRCSRWRIEDLQAFEAKAEAARGAA